MAGPPNIPGVGAEFYRRGDPLGQANISLPTLMIVQTSDVTSTTQTWASQTETREKTDWFRSGAANNFVTWSGVGARNCDSSYTVRRIYSRTAIRGQRSQLPTVHGQVPVFMHTSTHVCTHRQLYSSTHTYWIRRPNHDSRSNASNVKSPIQAGVGNHAHIDPSS